MIRCIVALLHCCTVNYNNAYCDCVMSFPALQITVTCMSVAYGMTSFIIFHPSVFTRSNNFSNFTQWKLLNLYTQVNHTPRYKIGGLAGKTIGYNWQASGNNLYLMPLHDC